MTNYWAEMYQKKVIAPTDLTTRVKELKANKHSIVTLNGSFDLLHAGHLHIIYEAAKQGSCLIVAVNSDCSIQKYKNGKGPLICLEKRLQMIAALEFVHYVTWFMETTPLNLLSLIQPDVHVNGSEYGENCIEADTVKAYGGKLYLVSRLPGLSTSSLIQKIKTRECTCG